ncbi:MAG: hypothetical protein L3J16_01035 [Anaerolineales bacterium]|nr:hypothetical protein [Anaerolineales bacterium]
MNSENVVSRQYLEEIWAKLACGSLDMFDPTNSSAEIFRWRGKARIATGGVSKGGNMGAKSVTIREVVPLAFWGDRPFNDLDLRGPACYTGGRFHPKGNRKEIWVITDNRITLTADPALDRQEAVQMSFA